MKIVSVVGARPQFVKASAVSHVVRNEFASCVSEVLVHTGQHFDANMSDVFFDELDIPAPAYNLGVSGGSHGAMTGRMLEEIERVLLSERPDCLLTYGDTNSTLAAALAGAKLHIPIAHVEAGLRSFNMRMPEEINRIITDRVSDLLFCPTQTAVRNLEREGITRGVHLVGDVMYDVALNARAESRARSTIVERLGLTGRSFVVATCHRAENTDDEKRLLAILSGLAAVARTTPVVLSLHPRTRGVIEAPRFGELCRGLLVVEPLPFFDMARLSAAAAVVATDSGGLQKEAFFYRVPCVTLRDETEWVETVEAGWNRIVPPGQVDIAYAIREALASTPAEPPAYYGDGTAASRIVSILYDYFMRRADQ